MRVLWLLCCALYGTAGCAPEHECGGSLYYDPALVSCRPCPAGSTLRGGSCQPLDGAVASGSDASVCDEDAGAAEGCHGYCSFIAACIADNGIAALGLPDVISGLHADDSAACALSCQADLGCAADDPVTACIIVGRERTACAGDDTQAGLERTLALLGECCGAYQDNMLCQSVCRTLKGNAFLTDNVPFCP